MKHSRKVVLLIVVSIAGAVLANRLFDAGKKEHETVDLLQRTQATTEPENRRTAVLDAGSRRERKQGAAAPPLTVGTHTPQQFADGLSTPETKVAGQAQSQSQREEYASGALEAQGVDFSVVGQPFPVSASILADCEPKLGMRPSLSCEPNKKLLDEMAEEPREEPWASAAERSIRALVQLEPGTDRPRSVTYTIRNLECRKSICFLETSSHMGHFSTQLYYFEKTSGLRAGYAIDAVEIAEDRTRVHVTLWPFVRNGRGR
jgi:hypothetical protein